MLAFHKENTVSQKKHRNISNIYVIIFGKYLQFWRLRYTWMTYHTWYVRFSNIIFNNNMIKISEIYVSTTVSLLNMIYFCHNKENIQHSMWDHSYFKTNSMETTNEKYWQNFILSQCVFVTSIFTLVYLEVIANIQCYIYTSKNTVLMYIWMT